DPMDLDNIRTKKRFRKLSKEEKQRRYDAKACLYCSKGGYFADKYPSKKADKGNKNTSIQEGTKVSMIRTVSTNGQKTLSGQEILQRIQNRVCWKCASAQYTGIECSIKH